MVSIFGKLLWFWVETELPIISSPLIPATMGLLAVQVEHQGSDQQLVKREGEAHACTETFFICFVHVPSIVLHPQELEMVEMHTVIPVSGSWAKPGEMGGLAQVHCNTCTPYGPQRRLRQVRAKREWRWGKRCAVGVLLPSRGPGGGESFE